MVPIVAIPAQLVAIHQLGFDIWIKVLLRCRCCQHTEIKMKLFNIMTVIALGAFLSACAQQEEPAPMVEPEPVYDKYGNPV